MKKLTVNLTGREYEILIGSGLLDNIGTIIKSSFSPDKIVIVTDNNVNQLYGNDVRNKLMQAGFSVKLVSLAPGEQTKSLESLSRLYDEAFSFQITRSDMIIALGGGVIGDLAGFMAATVLRGVPFIQLPTTLLAQVDSSVGGKVAIDTPCGKNLVGAFYQPKLVVIDTDTLSTLSDRILFYGLAEVIKYGLIQDETLFNKLVFFDDRTDIEAYLEDIVYTCCDIKRRIVEEDELDTGLRMVLNFGHTIGHIVEKEYHYETYTHGQAVAYGMLSACQIGERLGTTPAGIADKLKDMLIKYHLPTDISLPNDIASTLMLDKKSTGSQIHIILLKAVGEVFVQKMGGQEFADLFNSVRE